jgi:DNA-binding transcriptional LysR family regulator
MRDFNLDQLRSFLAVIELGNFSAAARQLNLSQPAVSIQIRELESRVGLRLIERLGKRAFPTAAGTDLATHARRIQAEVEQADLTMHRHRDGYLGKVRIGSGAATLTYLLPPVLRRLRDSHPNIEVSVVTGTTSGIVEQLLANRLDLGVVTLPAQHPLIEITPINTKQLVAILPGDRPNLPDRPRPADLADMPLVIEERGSNLTALILEWLAAGGVRPHPILEYNGLEAVKAIVGAGLGYTIIQTEAAMDGVARDRFVVRPLDPPLSRVIALAQRRDKPDSLALRLVRDAVMTLGAAPPTLKA